MEQFIVRYEYQGRDGYWKKDEIEVNYPIDKEDITEDTISQVREAAGVVIRNKANNYRITNVIYC